MCLKAIFTTDYGFRKILAEADMLNKIALNVRAVSSHFHTAVRVG
jgi:hypothetical protein